MLMALQVAIPTSTMLVGPSLFKIFVIKVLIIKMVVTPFNPKKIQDKIT
jgi:hypothetical protein